MQAKRPSFVIKCFGSVGILVRTNYVCSGELWTWLVSVGCLADSLSVNEPHWQGFLSYSAPLVGLWKRLVSQFFLLIMNYKG
jgi:hypothetical protein